MNINLKITSRSIFQFFIILTIAAVLSIAASCTAKKMTDTADYPITPKSPIYSTTPKAPKPSATRKVTMQSSADEIEKRIRDEYRLWQGTRHKMGGTGSQGIDCSGFVKAVYRDVFNIHLPRTTREQVKLGRPVRFEELQPGDLVFFKPPTYARHVGIFLSRSEFVHASKNKGVTVSKIDALYWGKYYWKSRRILHASETR